MGANLDAVIELRSSDGQIISTADPNDAFGATITANVAEGRYFLVVQSTGTYGHIGTYSITGTIQALAAGFYLDGTDLAVFGGGNNDTLTMNSAQTFQLESGGQTVNFSAVVTSIWFNGDSGYDRVVLNDTNNITLNTTWDDGAQLAGQGYSVDLFNVDLIIISDNGNGIPEIYNVSSGGSSDVFQQARIFNASVNSLAKIMDKIHGQSAETQEQHRNTDSLPQREIEPKGRIDAFWETLENRPHQPLESFLPPTFHHSIETTAAKDPFDNLSLSDFPILWDSPIDI